MPDWRFELTDSDYRPIGEIRNAKDRTVSLPLSKPDTCGFNVRLDNPLADFFMSASGNIKAYRNDVLRFFGPIITAEENGATGDSTIAVTATSPVWFFGRRFSVEGTPGGYDLYNNVDRAAIVDDLIINTNFGVGETGVLSDPSNTAASTVVYYAQCYRKLDEVIGELSSGFAGFDWRCLPYENFDPTTGSVTSTQIGTFYSRPVIGSNRDEAVFEMGLGTRNNISSYKRTISRETQANSVWHFAGPNATIVNATQDESIATYHVMEDEAQAEITDNLMRQQLVSDHIAARAYPRQVLQFVPSIDPADIGVVPRFGIDYDVGDAVHVRIVNEGVTRVNALVRIWGVTFSIDENGMERSAYVLAEE